MKDKKENEKENCISFISLCNCNVPGDRMWKQGKGCRNDKDSRWKNSVGPLVFRWKNSSQCISGVMYYNKAAFEKAGIDPATIKTWQDLAAAAEKMTASDSVCIYAIVVYQWNRRRYGYERIIPFLDKESKEKTRSDA